MTCIMERGYLQGEESPPRIPHSTTGTAYLQKLNIINPRRMHRRVTVVVLCVCVCVCLSVCVFVTMLAATYLICMPKVRHHRVSCRL